MSKRNWTAVFVFGAVVMLVVVAGCGLLWILSGAFGAIAGPRIMDPGGMMGVGCTGCGGAGVFGRGTPAGLLILLLAAPVVLGALGLLIVGVIWLVHRSALESD